MYSGADVCEFLPAYRGLQDPSARRGGGGGGGGGGRSARGPGKGWPAAVPACSGVGSGSAVCRGWWTRGRHAGLGGGGALNDQLADATSGGGLHDPSTYLVLFMKRYEQQDVYPCL